MVLGAALCAFSGLADDGPSLYALIGGLVGLGLGGSYLGSPTWRLTVVVDDEALSVEGRRSRRFRLPWDQVERVWASASTQTCFVDGGAPERSLLVPGPGANAPYDIADRAALYQLIVARVAADRIEWVELIETALSGDGGPAARPT